MLLYDGAAHSEAKRSEDTSGVRVGGPSGSRSVVNRDWLGACKTKQRSESMRSGVNAERKSKEQKHFQLIKNFYCCFFIDMKAAFKWTEIIARDLFLNTVFVHLQMKAQQKYLHCTDDTCSPSVKQHLRFILLIKPSEHPILPLCCYGYIFKLHCISQRRVTQHTSALCCWTHLRQRRAAHTSSVPEEISLRSQTVT